MSYDAGATATISQSSQSVDIRDVASSYLPLRPITGMAQQALRVLTVAQPFSSPSSRRLAGREPWRRRRYDRAICGQLVGAFWGESDIPEPLRSGLARMDMLKNAVAGILGA